MSTDFCQSFRGCQLYLHFEVCMLPKNNKTMATDFSTKQQNGKLGVNFVYFSKLS